MQSSSRSRYERAEEKAGPMPKPRSANTGAVSGRCAMACCTSLGLLQSGRTYLLVHCMCLCAEPDEDARSLRGGLDRHIHLTAGSSGVPV